MGGAAWALTRIAGCARSCETSDRHVAGKTFAPNNKTRKASNKKMKDLNAKDEQGAINIVAGSARSMGITVE